MKKMTARNLIMMRSDSIRNAQIFSKKRKRESKKSASILFRLQLYKVRKERKGHYICDYLFRQLLILNVILIRPLQCEASAAASAFLARGFRNSTK